MNVMNMLNTKYFIAKAEDNQPIAQRNPNALGNAWFVSDILIADNADDEIKKLGEINTAEQVIIDKAIQSADFIDYDSTASIELTQYKANYLAYRTNSTKEQFAVFSLRFFGDKGWNSYVDGELVPHFRANYVLRAMSIPPGQHDIEFRFEPSTYYVSEKLSLASSLVVILALAGVVFKAVKD